MVYVSLKSEVDHERQQDVETKKRLKMYELKMNSETDITHRITTKLSALGSF